MMRLQFDVTFAFTYGKVRQRAEVKQGRFDQLRQNSAALRTKALHVFVIHCGTPDASKAAFRPPDFRQ
jgi:hypothetical protein